MGYTENKGRLCIVDRLSDYMRLLIQCMENTLHLYYDAVDRQNHKLESFMFHTHFTCEPSKQVKFLSHLGLTHMNSRAYMGGIVLCGPILEVGGVGWGYKDWRVSV